MPFVDLRTSCAQSSTRAIYITKEVKSGMESLLDHLNAMSVVAISIETTMICFPIHYNHDVLFDKTIAMLIDGILPSSVSNLRGDYHNPLPAKLVHTRKINHRRLVICWKTRW